MRSSASPPVTSSGRDETTSTLMSCVSCARASSGTVPRLIATKAAKRPTFALTLASLVFVQSDARSPCGSEVRLFRSRHREEILVEVILVVFGADILQQFVFDLA